MIKETKNSLYENKERCSLFKLKALNGKEWSFIPKNFQISNETFGELKFEDIFNRSEATFQFVINEFSKFKESNDYHNSPSCIVANLPWKISARKNKQETTSSCGLEWYLECNEDDYSTLDLQIFLFFNHFK